MLYVQELYKKYEYRYYKNHMIEYVMIRMKYNATYASTFSITSEYFLACFISFGLD